MTDLILTTFFNNPMSRFGVRELSRQTKLDTKTVMKYLKEYLRKKLIIKKHEKNTFPYYEANKLSKIYKFEKSHLLIKSIIESDLIAFLEKKLEPKVIVLFGSVAKGTYHEKSDIDLFIQAKYKLLDLQSYERKLNHKISLFFEENLADLSDELLVNIYNGNALYGKLEIVKR